LLLASTDRGAKWNAAGDNGEQKGKGASEDDAAAVAGQDTVLEASNGTPGPGSPGSRARRRTVATGVVRLRARGEAGSG